jgi:hypothetical protein
MQKSMTDSSETHNATQNIVEIADAFGVAELVDALRE